MRYGRKKKAYTNACRKILFNNDLKQCKNDFPTGTLKRVAVLVITRAMSIKIDLQEEHNIYVCMHRVVIVFKYCYANRVGLSKQPVIRDDYSRILVRITVILCFTKKTLLLHFRDILQQSINHFDFCDVRHNIQGDQNCMLQTVRENNRKCTIK